MKSSTLLGILLGFAAIFGAYYLEGGTYDSLFLLPAMLIVLGGTLAAGIAGSSLSQILRIPRLIIYTISPKTPNVESVVAQIVSFATIARRDGVLALEDKLDNIETPFLKHLVRLCIDGADSTVLRQLADSETNHISERHNENISLFSKLGGYSPTMGIIGTVMGLISTLASAGDDPTVLIHHIASAFIATLWGILMANLVWLPIADKLKMLHKQEMRTYQLMYDGMYGILTGEIPSVIQSRMLTYFPAKEQAEMLKTKSKYRVQ